MENQEVGHADGRYVTTNLVEGAAQLGINALSEKAPVIAQGLTVLNHIASVVDITYDAAAEAQIEMANADNE